MDRHIIDTGVIEQIKTTGCCLGKYRVLMDGSYYCYLEDAFQCENQDKQYVKKLKSHMFFCKTNSQLPCAECPKYNAAARKA